MGSTKILHIGTEIHHELGCTASLAIQGYDVTYLHLGNKNEPLASKLVCTDAGSVKVKMAQIYNFPPSKVLHSSNDWYSKAVLSENYDILLVTPRTPFYLAQAVVKRQRIPLILRVWGVRANKLLDHIAYGKNYGELIGFLPSTAHNLFQISLSHRVVTLDCSTNRFLKRISWLKRPRLIYPTYSTIYGNSESQKDAEVLSNLDALAKDTYILSFVTTNRVGGALCFEFALLKLLYLIAKRNPGIKVLIGGGDFLEAKKAFCLEQVPKNFLFLGRGFSDDVVKELYANAKLVVMPVFSKSVSNRLLEALYYQKPILTNTVATLLHKELSSENVFLSDDFTNYPQIVGSLVNDDIACKKLCSGARDAYFSFFSAKKHGLAMKRLVDDLLLNPHKR